MSDYLQAMFRRRPNDGWFKAGRYDATTVDILCALAVATMFIYGANRSWFDKLLFYPEGVRDFEVWRLVTWPIATQPEFFALLGVVFFWLFGQQLEGLFGRNRFLMWVIAVALIPAIALTLLSGLSDNLNLFTLEFGLSTLFLGGIWVYAATYPGVRWFEVIPLWAIAAIFTLLNLLQYTGARATGKVLFLLISVAGALLAGRSLGLATGWPIPHINLTGGASSGRSRPSRRRQPKRRGRRSKGPSGFAGSKVVDGPWKNAPAPTAPPTGPSPADQAELDSLLDKIGASGMESLSGAEKKRLNELSKRLRNR